MSGIISNRGKGRCASRGLLGIPVRGAKGASAHVSGFVEALRSEGHDLFVLAANIGEDADPSFPLRQVPFGSTLIELYDALQNESICAGTPQKKDRRWLAACDVCVLNVSEDDYFHCIARAATGERLIEYRPLSRAA